jgi:hypothetical protein
MKENPQQKERRVNQERRVDTAAQYNSFERRFATRRDSDQRYARKSVEHETWIIP